MDESWPRAKRPCPIKQPQNPGEKKISLEFHDEGLGDILQVIQEKSGLKIGATPYFKGNVTLQPSNRSPRAALRLIAASHGFGLRFEGNKVIMGTACNEASGRALVVYNNHNLHLEPGQSSRGDSG